jgi:hypothetical protein
MISQADHGQGMFIVHLATSSGGHFTPIDNLPEMHSDIVLYYAEFRVFIIVFRQNGARGLTQVVAGPLRGEEFQSRIAIVSTALGSLFVVLPIGP